MQYSQNFINEYCSNCHLKAYENNSFKQLPCQHKLCITCINQLRKHKQQVKCLKCRKESNKSMDAFPFKVLNRNEGNINQELLLKNNAIKNNSIQKLSNMMDLLNQSEEYDENIEEFPNFLKIQETITEKKEKKEIERFQSIKQDSKEEIYEQICQELEQKQKEIKELKEQIKKQQQDIDFFKNSQKKFSDIQQDKNQEINLSDQVSIVQNQYKELKIKHDQLRKEIIKLQNQEKENQNVILILQNDIRNKTIESQLLNEKNDCLHKKVILLEKVVNNTSFKEVEDNFSQSQIETKDQVIQQLQEEILFLKNQNSHKSSNNTNFLSNYQAIQKIQLYSYESQSNTKGNQNQEQGFPQEIFVHQKFIQQFICQICIDVLNNPKFCKNCSIPFCNFCIKNLKQNYCPNCNKELSCFDQPFTNRLINNLEVRCQFCKSEMQLDIYLKHKNKCDQMPTQCPNKRCSKILSLNCLDEHIKKCELADYFCNICCLLIQQSQIQTHDCIVEMKNKIKHLLDSKSQENPTISQVDFYEKEDWIEVFLKHTQQPK